MSLGPAGDISYSFAAFRRAVIESSSRAHAADRRSGDVCAIHATHTHGADHDPRIRAPDDRPVLGNHASHGVRSSGRDNDSRGTGVLPPRGGAVRKLDDAGQSFLLQDSGTNEHCSSPGAGCRAGSSPFSRTPLRPRWAGPRGDETVGGARGGPGWAGSGCLSVTYAPRPSDSCFHRAETPEVHPLRPQQDQADTLITEWTSPRWPASPGRSWCPGPGAGRAWR